MKPPALNLTLARRRLLADVQHHRVYQHPDGASLNAGFSGRQVTHRIAHLEGAGWVRLGEGSDYDVRYWELTDAGRRALAEAQP